MTSFEKATLMHLNPEDIEIPDSVRCLERKSALLSLSKSIRAVGMLEPIGVRKDKDKYILLYGSRRLLAARLAGLGTIPCLVSDGDMPSADTLSLHENLHRKPLHYFELSDAYIRILKQNRSTVGAVAESLCTSEKSVRQKCILSVLPKSVRDDILRRRLTEREAFTLCTLSDEGSPVFSDPAPLHGKGCCRDLRLYMNSIRHTVDRMEQAGLCASCEQEENDGAVVWRILIKKT